MGILIQILIFLSAVHGCNLVPRAHVSFGQRQLRVLALTKRHVGSGNEIVHGC